MENKKLIEMANLEVDCKIGKDRHFIAADRKNRYRIALGLFAVIGSAIISSGVGDNALSLVGMYIQNKDIWKGWSDVISHILPLLVGISTAILGFLGLEKQTAQHRYVGNSYIEISRKTRSIINSITNDNFIEKSKGFDALVEKYLEANKEGESCPTNDRDNDRAMSMNSARRSSIKKKIAEHDREIFKISEAPPKARPPSLIDSIKKSLKIKLACTLAAVGLIGKSDYRKILKWAADNKR